jgi:hypothetical protein
MDSNSAYNYLMKISGMYNRKLNDDQYALWLEELEILNEIAVKKAIKSLKNNNSYENIMPTIPQFLAIYKTFLYVKEKEEDYCFVCNNRGFEILRLYKDFGGQVIPYDYMLHCDKCSKGKMQKVACGGYYSEPISKYFDIAKLILENKKNYTKNQESKEKEKKVKKQLKEVYFALSLKK